MHRLLNNDNRNSLPQYISFHPLRLTFDAKQALARAEGNLPFPLTLSYGENEHTLTLGDKTFTLTLRTNEPSNREVLYSKSETVSGQFNLKGRIGARMVIKPELTESSREHIRNVGLECERVKKSRSVIVAGPDGKFQSAPPPPPPKSREPERRNNRLFIRDEPPPRPGKPNAHRRKFAAAAIASSVPSRSEKVNNQNQSGAATQTSKFKEPKARKTKSQTRKPTKSKPGTETAARPGLRERVAEFIAMEIKSTKDILEDAEKVYPGIELSEVESALKEVGCVRKGSWLLKPREYANIRIWNNDSFSEETKRIVARKAESSFRKLKLPVNAEEWTRIVDPITNLLPSMSKKRKPALASNTGATNKKNKSQLVGTCDVLRPEETSIAHCANADVIKKSTLRRSASETSVVATRGSTVNPSALSGTIDDLKSPNRKDDRPASPTNRKKARADLAQTAILIADGQPGGSSGTCTARVSAKKPKEVVASRQRSNFADGTEEKSTEVRLFMPRHRTVRLQGATVRQVSDGAKSTDARNTGQDRPAIKLLSPLLLPTTTNQAAGLPSPVFPATRKRGVQRVPLTEEERQRMGRLKRLLADAREQLRPWYPEYDRLVRESEAGTLKDEGRLEKTFEEIGGERVVRWKRDLGALLAKDGMK